MKLDILLKAAQVKAAAGLPAREIAGVVCDSRQVRPGFLFVAIPGSARDGAQYVDDAIQRGAAAIVAGPAGAARKDVAWIPVPDARLALGLLADAFHGHPSGRLKTIGITGTNGKTTTAYMCHAILEAAGLRPGLITTVEYRVGDRAIPASRTTPEAPALQSLLAQMAGIGCGAAVMEASSHALDQHRTEGVDFDVGVFTNLSRDHLDYHETPEKYFLAKTALFLGLGRRQKQAHAAINAGDDWGRRLLAMRDLCANVVSFGFAEDAAVRAEGLQLVSTGALATVETPWGRAPLRLRLMGRHNVCNALGAIAACGALGVPVEAMTRALEAMPPVPGRLQEIPTHRGFHVFVDYAHTDDALEKVLTTLREITRRKLIVVFGCGGNRDTTKRAPMGAVVSRLADYGIITSDNPRREEPAAIMAQIRAGFVDATRCETVEDRGAAIRRAVELAREGDVVLIAGKGHETFQEFASKSIPFDDRLVAARELERK